MAKTLYICYFGLREPLVQTQVLPYLRELLREGEKGSGGEGEWGREGVPGIEVSLLTFEPDFKTKWTSEQIEAERARLAAEGIEWHCLAYHKWPSVPATIYDIFRGTLFVRRFIAERKPDILHGRVHLPTLMAAMARKLSRHKPKLLFDIRGFFPEEYTDAGIWPAGGWLYRGAKSVERWLMKEADGFVVLTEKAKEILFPSDDGQVTSDETEANPQSAIRNPQSEGRPVEVIPCCVDISRFEGGLTREAAREKLGVADRFVVAYVGSFGGWYLTDEMLDFFEAARAFRTDTFILILTQRDKEKIAERLMERGFASSDFLVESVGPSEIADYLITGDVAISFIKACYSKLSSSPTKIAEYLACGVPVIANPGVGDIDELINENGVGALTDELSHNGYLRALNEVVALGNIGDRCRETARREFDLECVGGVRYRRLYGKLLR